VDSVSIAAVLLGATAGFLLYNWPPARIFLGDSGSMPVGFLLAGLPLLSPARERGAAVLAVAVGLSLFLLDPLATLLRRARQGKRIGEAHREHAYQRLFSPAEPHAHVTTALVLAALVLSGLGALAFRFPRARWPALVVSVLAFAIEGALARRADSRRAALASAESPQRHH
jgi:Fuc2NAc and GlcNAc transferase